MLKKETDLILKVAFNHWRVKSENEQTRYKIDWNRKDAEEK